MTAAAGGRRTEDAPVRFRCPVCGLDLRRDGNRWQCAGGHSFDIARQGYVNLLMSNQSNAKRHGDDRVMVQARQRFLEQGYYNCLRDSICREAVAFTGDTVFLVDVGCGEGWYTAAVRQALEQSGKSCRACGIDISRAALIQAEKRDREICYAVGSVRTIPVQSESADLVLSIFAPVNDSEFYRILKKGGTLIAALPSEDHLFELKAAVYERPYRNPEPQYEPEGFDRIKREEIRDRIHLRSQEDIRNLFMMTPYYYKTGREDQEKLMSYRELETGIGFSVFVFRKE